MRAVLIRTHGGPDVLEVVDVSQPEPDAGQLLVDVAAIGVNYRDVYERNGGYGGDLPAIIGIEGAGTVIESGRRVAWVSAPASYAEQVVVATPSERCRCRTVSTTRSPPPGCSRGSPPST
jgi:NADPH2:quinone reductase